MWKLTYCVSPPQGSWLLLQSIDTLPSSTLQTVCSLLVSIQQARVNHSSTIQWMKNTVPVSINPSGVCFATMAADRQIEFPNTLNEFFQNCTVNLPDKKVILEALFLVDEFSTSQNLAQLLHKVSLGIEELFSGLGSVKSAQNSFKLSLHKLKAIISLASKHMNDFEGLGLLSGDSNTNNNNALKMPSAVYSEMSQSTKRASLKFGRGGENDCEHLSRPALEEFSLLLALKDTLLPSAHRQGNEYDVMTTLISELFPDCDLRGMLSHEASVREGLAMEAATSCDPEGSARESRAASVMHNVLDENQTSESTCAIYKCPVLYSYVAILLFVNCMGQPLQTLD